MLLLAYSSTASYDFTDGDLITLLMNSRKNNRREGITGLLLHDKGRFLQILEGEPDTVHGRYNTIRNDPRHHDVTLVAEQEQPDRQFPKWSMGYTALNDPLVRSIPGFTDFFHEDTRQRSAAVAASWTISEKATNSWRWWNPTNHLSTPDRRSKAPLRSSEASSLPRHRPRQSVVDARSRRDAADPYRRRPEQRT